MNKLFVAPLLRHTAYPTAEVSAYPILFGPHLPHTHITVVAQCPMRARI